MDDTFYDNLIVKHRNRLQELESEALSHANKFSELFSDDWRGKLMFCMALALAMKRMCIVTPGVNEATFGHDVAIGAAIWIDSGEPLRKASKDSSTGNTATACHVKLARPKRNPRIDMKIMWGVFEKFDFDFNHIAPCDEDGWILPPHIGSVDCPCEPEVDEQRGMIIHNMIQ